MRIWRIHGLKRQVIGFCDKPPSLGRINARRLQLCLVQTRASTPSRKPPHGPSKPRAGRRLLMQSTVIACLVGCRISILVHRIELKCWPGHWAHAREIQLLATTGLPLAASNIMHQQLRLSVSGQHVWARHHCGTSTELIHGCGSSHE